jgi:copper resistance protein B
MKITGSSACLLAAAFLTPVPLLAQPAVDHSQHMAQGTVNAGGQSRAGPLPQGDGGRDPHAYSGGYQRGAGLYALEHGHDQLHVVDSHRFGALIIDQLESVNGDEGEATAYDLQAWLSQGLQRVTLKAEGDIEHGKLEESRTELLWGKALSAYWDTQLGIRHDMGDNPSQSWLAAGVQGLAPYWFEIDATGYLGSGGQTALRLDVEYDLLLTQQLILQPAAEFTLYGKNDASRGLGSGLSDATLGVRLRYEFSRQFAPYVGIERTTRFGQTADFARKAGLHSRDTQWVAGVRFWL